MRRPQAAANRSLLLRTATDLLLERGRPVSIQQIRRCAGLSNGSVYHCFKDGDAMWAALRAEILAVRQARVAAALATTRRPAEDGVRAMVEAYLRWASEEARSARVLFLIPPSTPGPEGAMAGQAGHLQQELTTIEAWAAPLIAGGSIQDLPAETLHTFLFGQADLVVRSWLAGGCKDDLLTLAPMLGQAAWAAIKAKAAPRPPARAGTPPRKNDRGAQLL